MGYITIDNALSFKDGDVIRVQYLALVGEILFSRAIVFRLATVKKNRVIIHYSIRRNTKKMHEISNIISIEKL